MDVICKIIRQMTMTKKTKCPIFLEAMNLLIKITFFNGFIAQYFVAFFIDHPVICKVCWLKHTFSSMFSNEKVYLFKSAHFKATYICAEVAQILGIKYEVKNE